MRKGTRVAGLGLGAALLFTGCAETYGEGSMLTDNNGCDPTSTTIKLDEAGDGFRYAIDDLSVEGPDLHVEAWDVSSVGRVEDHLTVEAVGVEGSDRVDEIVVTGEKMIIEVIDTLDVDMTQEADEEFRVDLSDIREDEDNTFAFEVREGNSETRVTVEALAVGANVTVEQNCVAQPTVVD